MTCFGFHVLRLMVNRCGTLGDRIVSIVETHHLSLLVCINPHHVDAVSISEAAAAVNAFCVGIGWRPRSLLQ